MQIYLYKVLSCDSIFEYEKSGENVRLLNFCDLLLDCNDQEIIIKCHGHLFKYLTIFKKIFCPDMYSFIYIIIAIKFAVKVKDVFLKNLFPYFHSDQTDYDYQFKKDNSVLSVLIKYIENNKSYKQDGSCYFNVLPFKVNTCLIILSTNLCAILGTLVLK